MYYTHVHPCTTLYTACMPLVYNCERPSYYRGHGLGSDGDAGGMRVLCITWVKPPDALPWCSGVTPSGGPPPPVAAPLQGHTNTDENTTDSNKHMPDLARQGLPPQWVLAVGCHQRGQGRGRGPQTEALQAAEECPAGRSRRPLLHHVLALPQWEPPHRRAYLGPSGTPA